MFREREKLSPWKKGLWRITHISNYYFEGSSTSSVNLWYKIDKFKYKGHNRIFTVGLERTTSRGLYGGILQHVLYLWNDDYRKILIFSGLTVIVNLDYSVPGRAVADKNLKKIKSKRCITGRNLNPEVFMHLTNKDQVGYDCTDYLPTIITKISLTSPIIINVPIRASLAVENKGSFVPVVGIFEWQK